MASSEYNKEYYKKNREVILAQVKRYRQDNHEKKLQYDRDRYYSKPKELNKKTREYYQKHRQEVLKQKNEYYLKNKERIRRYNADYYQKNREFALEYASMYQKEHPEVATAIQHKRRARKLGGEGSYTIEELNALFEQQEGFCYYCKELLYSSFDKQIHVEHMTPLCRGGTNSIDNIVLSCSKCNFSKHTKTAEEFLAQLGRG